ncbi:MAG: DUF1318 domain-containing protein [Planctomycetes bacterium]|nr:DUF1318 domain-containing protein [Planctomycetota bacterium]
MKRLLALVLATSLSASCIPVTVNLTFAFPPKEMEQKLIDMENKLHEEGQPKGQAAAFDPVMDLQDAVNITVETPAIKEINERRKKRLSEVEAHLGAGRVGEGNDARLQEREVGNLAGKEKAAFRKLVNAENEDRESLLREILKANKLADDQMDNVRRVYARARMKVAQVGWWIQTAKGTWVKKTEEHKKKLDKDEEIDE